MDREKKVKLSEISIHIAKLLGASYSDFRIVESLSESISMRNGEIRSIQTERSAGFAVRVIKNGAFGFASSPVLSEDEVKRVTKLAVETAEASTLKKKKDVVLAPEDIHRDTYETPILVDPFKVSLKEKIELLKEWTSLLLTGSVSHVFAFMDFEREDKFFASSEGSLIFQTIYRTGGGVNLMAFGKGGRASRGYPTPSGKNRTGGYEVVESINVREEKEKILDEIEALLKAPPCPEGRFDIILDGSLLSLQIHESIAHALELDRVLGYEKSFSGTSYATIDKLGKLRIASPIVNIVVDGGYPGGLATHGYDDEGVRTRREYLIKNGILVNYLSSRDTAFLIGKRSTAALFAKGWVNLPIIRITNVNLLPGDKDLEEMISEIDRGYYLSGPASWSIDERRENFQLGAEIAWEIRGGKLGQVCRSPVYKGNTIEFWNSCDAIASSKYWDIWGTPSCGKGEPGQTIGTAQGASPARFRNVEMVR